MMSEQEQYIEAYFKGQLNDQEKLQMEELCLNDPSFAKKVALYITIEEGIRQKLLDQKKQQWTESAEVTKTVKVVQFKKSMLRKLIPYMAAASLLVAVVLIYLLSINSPQKLASQYVSENLTSLSQTMNVSADSLQQGIAAYNKKDYNKALLIFDKVSQTHPDNINAKKYKGLVYLVTKDYDKALQEFDELSSIKEAYKNPGAFLKAVTMLQRNKKDDKSEAKRLLELVVKEKSEGSKVAERWLEKW